MSICDEKHYLPLHLSNLSKPEIIEYLRIKHQRIYEEIHLLLKISSPQLLAYLLIEVLIQILHLYSIIVHIIYKFDNPTAGSTIILNCISIVWHGNGVYYLCWNMNILNEMVERLRRILTLCKFTTEDAEEHRQFRIFINKLGHQKSILINDYFEIDLGIIGPVVGNILTYVLVALQFKIPPQKTN
ncbi:hypothetical protein ABEB36_011014 [Hypothenemus hampei]|uniref:Uncharacterized protein n=1 Tax=Hypothenemus hampei TaxID=57062 RepID=A0ABD1EDY7_HYPHA